VTSATFSIAPSGCASIATMIWQRSSPSGWKSTAPAFSRPFVLFQAIRVSGICSVIVASHSSVLPATVAPPVQMLVVELTHLVDVLHEARELLELRPLVVGGANRHLELDRLLDLRHRFLPLSFG
jgi:hypothetical protein